MVEFKEENIAQRPQLYIILFWYSNKVSSKRILEESSGPGVEVLVLPLVVGIREISAGSSPTVEPGGRM